MITIEDLKKKQSEQSILRGLPIIIPLILFSEIISFNWVINSVVLVLAIVLKGVAIDCLSSHIDTPILLEPRSNPINLEGSACFFLNLQ